MTEAIEKLAHSAAMQLVGKVAMAILAIIAGLLLKEFWSMRDAQAKTDTQMSVMVSKIDDLTKASNDRYTQADAGRDNKFLQVQIDIIARRLDTFERSPRVIVRTAK